MKVNEYIQKFYKIKTKDGKLIPLVFNKAQQYFYDIIKANYGVKPGRYIVLKARQMGISTFTEAFIFNRTTCQFYSDGIIVAHQREAASKIYEMTKIQIVKAAYCRNPIVGNCGKHYSDRKQISR